MSILVKTFVLLSAVLVAGNVRLVEANVPAPFRLTNLNIQSVSLNASFFNFMTMSFNGNEDIWLMSWVLINIFSSFTHRNRLPNANSCL